MYTVDVFSVNDSLQFSGHNGISPSLLEGGLVLTLFWTTHFTYLSGNEMRLDTPLLQQQIFGVGCIY
jgi:hypothetical protein